MPHLIASGDPVEIYTILFEIIAEVFFMYAAFKMPKKYFPLFIGLMIGLVSTVQTITAGAIQLSWTDSNSTPTVLTGNSAYPIEVMQILIFLYNAILMTSKRVWRS